ncbi:hypothetical protein PMAYCL1PPCAC_10797, partial [Pristionchus mayeri]
ESVATINDYFYVQNYHSESLLHMQINNAHLHMHQAMKQSLERSKQYLRTDFKCTITMMGHVLQMMGGHALKKLKEMPITSNNLKCIPLTWHHREHPPSHLFLREWNQRQELFLLGGAEWKIHKCNFSAGSPRESRKIQL